MFLWNLSAVGPYAEGVDERADELFGKIPVASRHTTRTVQEKHDVSTTLTHTAWRQYNTMARQ